MSGDVAELLAALHDGRMSVEEVADRFRQRSWPRRHTTTPRTHQEIAQDALQDPDELIPDSFDEVAAAFYRGDISRSDYSVLADAAAESMRQEDLGKND